MHKETVTQIFWGQKMYYFRQQTRDSCGFGWGRAAVWRGQSSTTILREPLGKVSRNTLSVMNE